MLEYLLFVSLDQFLLFICERLPNILSTKLVTYTRSREPDKDVKLVANEYRAQGKPMKNDNN